MNTNLDQGVPHSSTDIHSPPDRLPQNPPTATLKDTLPFGDLTWENFEKLCHRLASLSETVADARLYGRRGQGQQGIDIYVRKKNSKYEIWQAKRYQSYSTSDLKSAIEKFEAGSWKSRSEVLVIAIQALINDVTLQEEIERQAARLKSDNIELKVYGGSELSDLLRPHPELVYSFFGTAWLEAFLGKSVADKYLDRTSTTDLNVVRQKLASIYNSHFQVFDSQFMASFDTLGQQGTQTRLVDRFTEPDVLIQIRSSVADTPPPTSDPTSSPSTREPQSDADKIRQSTKRRDSVRRIALSQWLPDGNSHAIFGEAGSGKSTTLRSIALDILGDQRIYPKAMSKWGERIPILIPFSRWVRASVTAGSQIGLKEIVRVTLQQLATVDLINLLDRIIDEGRILLLVDGLDEWSNEQAARATIAYIYTFVGAHSIPVVVTSRPRGLSKVWNIPANWNVSNIAPLSIGQQKALAIKTLRHTQGWSTGGDDEQKTERQATSFLGQISTDPAVAALASTPLMLLGLLVLVLRNVVLPRNKQQATRQLVEILLETHPQRRATEAGDVDSRFVHATSADMRRDIVAKLAFHMRSEGADAGFPIESAKLVVRSYLTDQAHHGLDERTAKLIADEMLAVNAETMGVLIEKAPGYVGFAHAIFEEFLSASHIQSWPFNDCLQFSSENCGATRWRNTLIFLIASLDRWKEADQIISAIEAARPDTFGAINKSLLLAEIGFNSARKSASVSTRLLSRSLEIIESGAWPSERKAILAAALSATSEPTTGPEIMSHFAKWFPRRETYIQYAVRAMRTWAPSPALKSTLIRCLSDEEPGTQIEAAQVIAKVFSGQPEVLDELRQLHLSTNNLATSAMSLMAIHAGWPDLPDLKALCEDAYSSEFSTLRMVGLFGLIGLGDTSDAKLEALLYWVSERSFSNYWLRPQAAFTLIKKWPNHPRVINICFNSIDRGHYSSRIMRIERDVAIQYLLSCDTQNSEILKWLLEEMDNDYPFPLHNNQWGEIVPFSDAHPALRTKIIEYFHRKDTVHFLYQIQDFIIKDRGDDLRTWLIDIFRNSVDGRMDQYWTLRAILYAWGPDDYEVKKLLEDIKGYTPEKLANIAQLLPMSFGPTEGRRLLLDIGQQVVDARNDMLARGFIQAGCDHTDSDVCELLISRIKNDFGYESGVDDIITSFGQHPTVRSYAIRRIELRDPPLGACAAAYGNDTEISKRVLEMCTPLPVFLRQTIADSAEATGERHVEILRLLKNYDLEVDTEIKIQLSSAYYSTLEGEAIDAEVPTLVQNCNAIGPDHSERRAAAFAGLIACKRVNAFAPLLGFDKKPMNISLSSSASVEESPTLLTNIVRNWSYIKQEIGPSLVDRLGEYGKNHTSLWDAIAPFLASSEEATDDFLSYCESAQAKLSEDSLTALAQLRPSSDLLLQHCRSILKDDSDRSRSPLHSMRTKISSIEVLKEMFPTDTEILECLRENADKRQSHEDLLLLSLLSPADPVFDKQREPLLDLGTSRGWWCLAISRASALLDENAFFEVFQASINRGFRSPWHFQEVMNKIVLSKLRDNPALYQLMRGSIFGTPNERASFSRFASLSGTEDPNLIGDLRQLLDEEHNRQKVCSAGFDAVDDTVRAVPLALVDALLGVEAI